MLSRIAAIFTVLYISSINNFASAQKNDKICEYCRKMATTGSSPYEILWTLRGGIGKEFMSEVLERKMLLRPTDIKQAEGIFLVYCSNLCPHTMEGKILDETGRSNSKKGKTLHFGSLQEEEKYKKLGKKEFKKFKNKIESALGVKKKTEAKKKPTTVRPHTKENSYAKIYKSLVPNLSFLNRLSSSRSLQPLLPENLTLDTTTITEIELSLRQAPDQTTNAPGSDSNTTDTSEEDHTTEASFETTEEDNSEETTMPTSSESDESTESFEESNEDDSTEEESDESKEPKDVSPKPNKSQNKDIENLIKYIIDLISDPDSDMVFKQAISLARSIVKCMIDITMTEVERALGINPGLLVRERCGTSDEPTFLESTILNFLKDILEQSSNLQSVIPLPGLILPPPVPQLQPVFQPELPPILEFQPELPPILEFQPELPPSFEFQPNYPDNSDTSYTNDILTQAPIQYYNDYDGGIPQQVISNLIPPPPTILPPFLPQNNDFQEEPNYPNHPESESFIAFPDLTQPLLPPSLKSTDALTSFIAWRRAMTDIRNNDGNYDEGE